MAAVKIIFDPPALSWPLSFLSPCFPTILSVTHYQIGSACNTLASDATIPIKIRPVKHLLTLHTNPPHIFIGFALLLTLFGPCLPVFDLFWLFLSAVHFQTVQKMEDSRRSGAFISPRLSHTFYLYSRVFSGRLQRSGTAITFQVPANTGGTQEARQFTQTKIQNDGLL